MNKLGIWSIKADCSPDLNS